MKHSERTGMLKHAEPIWNHRTTQKYVAPFWPVWIAHFGLTVATLIIIVWR